MKEHQDVQKNERNTCRQTKLNTQDWRQKVINECLANFLPHIAVALACCIPLASDASFNVLVRRYSSFPTLGLLCPYIVSFVKASLLVKSPCLFNFPSVFTGWVKVRMWRKLNTVVLSLRSAVFLYYGHDLLGNTASYGLKLMHIMQAKLRYHPLVTNKSFFKAKTKRTVLFKAIDFGVLIITFHPHSVYHSSGSIYNEIQILNYFALGHH